jgi:UDP-N-acetylmuramyl tripeptide synthase
LDSKEWPQALIGLYNKYNTMAAVLAARTVGIDDSVARRTVGEFQPAFGRAEELDVRGRRVRILLSKNPAGMNETIRLLESEFRAGHSRVALLVLNDRIPDGKDISWIWDADTEKLFQPGVTLVASGERAFDMGLRLQYSEAGEAPGVDLVIKQDLNEAITAALDCTQPGEILHVVPTYSAMLQVRQALVGRGIL